MDDGVAELLRCSRRTGSEESRNWYGGVSELERRSLRTEMEESRNWYGGVSELKWRSHRTGIEQSRICYGGVTELESSSPGSATEESPNWNRAVPDLLRRSRGPGTTRLGPGLVWGSGAGGRMGDSVRCTGACAAGIGPRKLSGAPEAVAAQRGRHPVPESFRGPGAPAGRAAPSILFHAIVLPGPSCALVFPSFQMGPSCNAAPGSNCPRECPCHC